MSESEEFIRMKLACPMPKLDFDIITLGHGSGGLLTHKLLNEFVFEALGDCLLNADHDGATLKIEGNIAMTTDSFVVSPIFFPGGNIGDLAINGTLNDLAMCGAKPTYLSLAFIIEEGFALADFWEVLMSIKWAAVQNEVKIVTGDTKVVDQGKGDQIFINTTGIGHILKQSQIDATRIQASDKIVLSGPLAAHGMAIMSKRDGLEFETTIESDTQCVYPIVEAAIQSFGEKIKLLRDPTRGGLATSLNEIAQTTGLGIQIQEASLPIDAQVKSACEILGFDPVYVANEGIFICVCKAEVADPLLETLRSIEGGNKACMIGEFVDAHPGQVVLETGIGGRRVLNMLLGEQLPRIC